MKTISLVLALLMLIPSLAAAGEIYGSIKEGEKAVGQGTKVEITIGSATYSTEIDKFGSYRVYVKEQGKCTLKVSYMKETPTFQISSYAESVRYDLILEKKEGKYTLRRK